MARTEGRERMPREMVSAIMTKGVNALLCGGSGGAGSYSCRHAY